MLSFNVVTRSVLISGSMAITFVPTLTAAQALQEAPVPISIVAQPSPTVATTAPVVEPVTLQPVSQLAAQTAIKLMPTADINAKKLKVGDQITLVTVADISLNAKTVIPAGTKAVAVVTEAVGGRSFGKGGQLTMAFKQLLPAKGDAIALSGMYSETGARQDSQQGYNLGATAGVLGGLGGFGALAGLFGSALLKGRSAVIKTGFQMTSFTTNAMVLSQDGTSLIAIPPESQNASAAAQPAAIALPTAPVAPAVAPK